MPNYVQDGTFHASQFTLSYKNLIIKYVYYFIRPMSILCTCSQAGNLLIRWFTGRSQTRWKCARIFARFGSNCCVGASMAFTTELTSNLYRRPHHETSTGITAHALLGAFFGSYSCLAVLYPNWRFRDFNRLIDWSPLDLRRADALVWLIDWLIGRLLNASHNPQSHTNWPKSWHGFDSSFPKDDWSAKHSLLGIPNHRGLFRVLNVGS